MKLIVILVSGALFLLGLWLNPLATLCGAMGLFVAGCWWIELTLGPLVRAAERTAKAFVNSETPAGELVSHLQEMSKLAFLRRNIP